MALEKAGAKLGRLKARLEVARVAFANSSMTLHNTNAMRVARRAQVDHNDDDVVLKNNLQNLQKADKKMRKLQSLVVAAKVNYRQKVRKFRTEIQLESEDADSTDGDDSD